LLPEPNIPSNGGRDGRESEGLTVIVTLSGALLTPCSLVTTTSKTMVSCTCVLGAVNVAFTEVGSFSHWRSPCLCPLIC